MENLLIAIIAGVGISLISGVLGCFIIWKKMAYFGDSLAHSALLGIAIGVIFSLPINFSVICVALAFALLLSYLQNKNILSIDALLGILAHGALALAIFLVNISKQEIDLEGILFGDISVVNLNQIYAIYSMVFLVLALIYLNWQKLILLTINKEIAISKNVNPRNLQIMFIVLIAISVMLSIKIVGTLLITSMLIIPAALAKQISNSPKKMMLFSTFFAIISMICGILISKNLEIATGPVVVLCSIALFIPVLVIRKVWG